MSRIRRAALSILVASAHGALVHAQAAIEDARILPSDPAMTTLFGAALAVGRRLDGRWNALRVAFRDRQR
ncbi:MAG: hypothetical protein R3F34_10295 [Planctomycetota bacterium]